MRFKFKMEVDPSLPPSLVMDRLRIRQVLMKLVELMGGDISVRSEKGKGTTFRVTLDNIAISKVKTGDHVEIKPDVEDIRFEKATLLVVDDKEVNRRLLKEYLAHSPIDFSEAQNGLEAVEKTKRFQPDLVLMDYKMPGMNGCEACRMLKDERQTKHIPVIIVTATRLKWQWQEIERSGRRPC